MVKKQEKWTKKRHVVMRNLAYVVLAPFAKYKFHCKVEKFREQGDRQYLILMNHETTFDQFFVGMAFKGATYYIASEDIFSNGIGSKLMKWAAAPIPINKTEKDLRSVMTCIKVAREGGTIALAPEGNRTYSGRQCYIKPSVVSLIKALKLPVAIFRIEGGYGIEPRWCELNRKGKMRAYVSRVIELEEYASMKDDELYGMLKNELSVDETKLPGIFEGNKRAEYIERLIYVCPHCGISEFESDKNTFRCKKCGRTAEYTVEKKIRGDFDFEYAADWYEYQQDYIRKLDLAAFGDKEICSDGANLYDIIPYVKKKCAEKNVTIRLFSDRIIIDRKNGQFAMPFENIRSMAVLGRNKLNICTTEGTYQIQGSKRFNALKYMNIYYHTKGIKEGENDAEFLGL